MIGERGISSRVEAAIAVDEVGIEYGVFGRYRLRSACQPIFARQRDVLVPVAVHASISPQCEGKRVGKRQFFAGLAVEDAPFIEELCRALHLRNRGNLGVEGLPLHLNYDLAADNGPAMSLEAIRRLSGQIEETGLDPRSLVVGIEDGAGLHLPVLSAAAAALRGIGVKIAIAESGTGASAGESLNPLRPDIVGIDGVWFGKLCRDKATVRLFGLLVSRFRETGAQVLVAGIEDAAQLHVALRSGADLFRGGHLAPLALVGAGFDGAPVSIAGKLDAGGGPLRLARTHQSG